MKHLTRQDTEVRSKGYKCVNKYLFYRGLHWPRGYSLRLAITSPLTALVRSRPWAVTCICLCNLDTKSHSEIVQLATVQILNFRKMQTCDFLDLVIKIIICFVSESFITTYFHSFSPKVMAFG